MKTCFQNANVKTADWIPGHGNNVTAILGWAQHEGKYLPVVSKSLTGSRGRGNRLHRTQEELQSFLNTHANNLGNYVFEAFYDYNREYRLHVTKDGCFYTCRKMLRSETPKEQRWFRNDSNCSWIIETNPDFDKPSNWSHIVAECVKALNAVGLDIGACDVKVQSSKDKKGGVRPTPEFIVIEINSAPSFGEGTLIKYLEQVPIILRNKHSYGNT